MHDTETYLIAILNWCAHVGENVSGRSERHARSRTLQVKKGRPSPANLNESLLILLFTDVHNTLSYD